MKTGFLCLLLISLAGSAISQNEHNHPIPEKLGTVSFPTSCAPAVQKKFERAVALQHSFAYSAAEDAFKDVLKDDPNCAMAHWGVAMSYYHQLWEPPIDKANLPKGRAELQQAMQVKQVTERERGYIAALAAYYADFEKLPPEMRAKAYEQRMAAVASANPTDNEAQVFYALSLLGTASMLDKTHANQKHAAEILEPMYAKFPDHPGIAHYLIHAYDSSELAPRGVAAARAYSKIAPSAPHALHMPSHIFTRLGMWDDSITSNLAARKAAHDQHDIGEELHAMDYLTYAYLQRGRERDAAQVLDDLKKMSSLRAADFKVGYASTVIPVRYAVERGQWNDAAELVPQSGAAPHVVAITHWARALGLARTGKLEPASAEVQQLKALEDQTTTSGNSYWAKLVHVQVLEAQAWLAQAQGKENDAVSLMRTAADQEDAVEKLPVTPGPIVPAREQLGELLLLQKNPAAGLTEYEVSLKSAPGRRQSLEGAARCAEMLGDREKASRYRAGL